MSRFLRSYGITQTNNFMWKGLLYHGWGVVAAVYNSLRMMMGMGN